MAALRQPGGPQAPSFGPAAPGWTGGLGAAGTPPSFPGNSPGDPYAGQTSAAPSFGGPTAGGQPGQGSLLYAQPGGPQTPSFGPSNPEWSGGLFGQPAGTPQNPTTQTNPGVPGNPASQPPYPAGPGFAPLPFTPIVPGIPENQPQVPQGPTSGTTQFGQGVESTLGDLLNTAGQVNQGVINSQIDQTRGLFNQQRNAQLDSDRAELADRGLLGSGAEGNALGTLDKNLGASYGSALSGILGNEYNSANQRMMTALTTGAGMSEADAQRKIDEYNAQTGRTGTLGELGLQGQAIGVQNQLGNRTLDTQSQLGNRGMDIQDELGNKTLSLQDLLGEGDLGLRKELGEGQLGLGEQGLNEDYSKFLGQLGLGRDQLAALISQGDTSGIESILQSLGLLTQTSANGHF